MAKTLQFGDLRKGAVYCLANPVRVAKVVEITTQSVKQPGTTIPAQRPIVKVVSTVPTKPIRNCVTLEQATVNRKVTNKSRAPKFWEETWGERAVDGVVMRNGVLTESDDPKDQQVVLWCLGEFGRPPRVQRGSGVTNTRINPQLVPPGNLPKGLFDGAKVVDPDEADYGEDEGEEEAA